MNAAPCHRPEARSGSRHFGRAGFPLAVSLWAMLAGVPLPGGFSRAHAADCAVATSETVNVSGLAGGGDLALRDGRVLRLAAVELGFDDDGHKVALETGLKELAVGHNLEVASAGEGPDRYGRIAGIVRLPQKADGMTLQQSLVELGLAVVRPEEGYLPCAAKLMPAEREARAQRLGLWAILPVRAHDVEAVRAFNGRYAVVEGRIFAAGTGRDVDYLNFGRVWRHDVTIRVPHASRAAFVQAGMPLDAFTKRPVRGRGVVFESGGPAIEARWPEQVEIEEEGIW